MSGLDTFKNWKGFAALQFLDILTTVAGFSIGLVEANPIISHFFPIIGPVVGLFFGKLLTISFILCYMTYKKSTKWVFVNYLFFALIIWNSSLITLRLISLV